MVGSKQLAGIFASRQATLHRKTTSSPTTYKTTSRREALSARPERWRFPVGAQWRDLLLPLFYANPASSAFNPLLFPLLWPRHFLSPAHTSSHAATRMPYMDFPRCPARSTRSAPYSCKTTVSNDLLTLIFPLYSMNPSFLNLFMKKFTRDRVVPTILAKVSCETFGSTLSGCSFCP